MAKNPHLREAIAIVEGVESTNTLVREMREVPSTSLSDGKDPGVSEFVGKVGAKNKH